MIKFIDRFISLNKNYSNECMSVLYDVEKIILSAEDTFWQGEGLISVPPAFRGRDDPLNPLGVTLAPLQSTILKYVFSFSFILAVENNLEKRCVTTPLHKE
ncbi:hypothetical protein AAHH17_17945 [Lysinibacillus capsici]|uniref:hypothetical protein n=1 Tax=Lysinibacillus capsici TaxID=2115968 RepID=UPI002E1F6D01|nr:hypothetical protein [Lysinibacillus capsici]